MDKQRFSRFRERSIGTRFHRGTQFLNSFSNRHVGFQAKISDEEFEKPVTPNKTDEVDFENIRYAIPKRTNTSKPEDSDLSEDFTIKAPAKKQDRNLD